MPLTMTWQLNNNPPETWTIPDTTLLALERLREATLEFQTVDGVPQRVPKYASVRQMIARTLLEQLVQPALSKFPPADLAALKQAAVDAKTAYEAARSAAQDSIVTP